MTKLFRSLSIVLVFASIILPGELLAEISSMSSAINKAGRQRMLSQRIVATYCQTGMEIRRSKSEQQLKAAIELFDGQLKELQAFRPSGEISRQFKKVEQLWQPMKRIASGPIQREKAEKLRALAEQVLKASHRAVLMLQDESGTQSARLVNISGRQRMLSQRLSSLYMLQSWGFKSTNYNNEYLQAINEFKAALTELNAAPVNTPQVKKKLKRARKQFAIVEVSLKQKEGDYIPLMFKLSADKLLGIMNDVTHLYEEIANQAELKRRKVAGQ